MIYNNKIEEALQITVHTAFQKKIDINYEVIKNLISNINKLDNQEILKIEDDVLSFFKHLSNQNIPVDLENYKSIVSKLFFYEITAFNNNEIKYEFRKKNN